MNCGHLATDRDALQKIHAPILGIFGAQDRGSTPADVKKFQKALSQRGKKIEVKVYRDAGHAFQNPNNQEGFRQADTADRSKRTADFLAKTLKE